MNKDKGKEKCNATTPTTRNVSAKKMRFRLQASRLFLTYPKCGLPKEEALLLLQEKVEAKSVTLVNYLIAAEKHKDGTDHLHAYLELSEKIDVRDQSYFDLLNFHGNYQGCRSAEAVKKYCSKDGTFVKSEGLKLEKSSTKMSTTFLEARSLARTDGLEAAMLKLEECPKAARDLCLYGKTLRNSMKELAPICAHEATRPLSDFGTLFEWPQDRVLILCGPTNTGKTTLAVSLLPLSLLTRHLDPLANYQESMRDGIVMDDISISHLHDEAQIALLDTAFETQVHVRYHVAVIPKGTRRIITTNRTACRTVNMGNPAIARRVFAITWLGIDNWKPWEFGDDW